MHLVEEKCMWPETRKLRSGNTQKALEHLCNIFHVKQSGVIWPRKEKDKLHFPPSEESKVLAAKLIGKKEDQGSNKD